MKQPPVLKQNAIDMMLPPPVVRVFGGGEAQMEILLVVSVTTAVLGLLSEIRKTGRECRKSTIPSGVATRPEVFVPRCRTHSFRPLIFLPCYSERGFTIRRTSFWRDPPA